MKFSDLCFWKKKSPKAVDETPKSDLIVVDDPEIEETTVTITVDGVEYSGISKEQFSELISLISEKYTTTHPESKGEIKKD